MSTTTTHSIHGVEDYGDLCLYRRGEWHKAERLPKYFVMRTATGHILEEFRRLDSARKWVRAQREAQA